VPDRAWNNLVVAIERTGSGMRCELRDGRFVSVPAEWRDQIAIADRMHIDSGIEALDRWTSFYIERQGRADLAQIPVVAAHPPKQDRRGESFIILDAAAGAPNGIARVPIESAQIRDYFFAPDRAVPWRQQASWFEILGALESSSPAEIRLAYRIRSLELAAAEENSAALSARLARGFEILLNPELRRQYLDLRRDPFFPVAFPPWTVGCLLTTGKKQAETFVVHRLLRFTPAIEEQTVGIPLRKLRFEGPVAVYRDARRKLLLRFDPYILPLRWTDESNGWVHLTLGSMKVTARFWQQTRFRRKGEAFEPVIWRQPLASTLTLQNTEALASRFEQARLFWRCFHPYADVVALLRARIEREPVKAEDAAQWCLAHGVTGPIDSRLINWERDYEDRYYQQLASRAQQIYLLRNEYLFVFDSAVIAEIPRPGHASYIFRPPGMLADFLRGYARTTRHEIRRNPAIARKELGYQGRIPHLQNLAAWLRSVLARSNPGDLSLRSAEA
ncbi:MAG: hypothetical protein ACRD6B_21160, partial [Bryobacteraceae bacterium]